MNKFIELDRLIELSKTIYTLKQAIEYEIKRGNRDYLLIEDYKENIKELEECKKELLQSLEY